MAPASHLAGPLDALLRRAEQMSMTGESTARLRDALSLARAAYDDWLVAKSAGDAVRDLALVGHRALLAALDAASGGRGELAATLFEVCRSALAAEEEGDTGKVPEFAGAWERSQLRVNATSGPPAAPAAPIAVLSFSAPPAAPPSGAAPPESPPPVVCTLERCAAIAASVARRTGDKADILTSNELTAAQWAELEGRWAETIRADIQRGRTDTLASYDEAYVAQLETERGPITVEEFARLSVASERGIEVSTLSELGLPRPSLPRIQRVWLRRTAADKQLAKRVREALEATEG